MPDDVQVVRQSLLRDRIAGGATVRDLAVELGVTPQTIHYHLKRLGLKPVRGWTAPG